MQGEQSSTAACGALPSLKSVRYCCAHNTPIVHYGCTLFMLLLLVISAEADVGAGQDTSAGGPYLPQPLRLVAVPVHTAAAFVASFANNTIDVIYVPINLLVPVSTWPQEQVNRTRSITILGDDQHRNILDLDMANARAVLGPGAELFVENLELRNARARIGFGFDLLGVSAPGTTVVLKNVAVFTFSCLPLDLLLGAIRASQRPPELADTRPQLVELAEPWCRTTPLINACYEAAITGTDCGFAIPPVQMPGIYGTGGFSILALQMTMVCQQPVSKECGAQKGYDACVTQQRQMLRLADRTWQLLQSHTPPDALSPPAPPPAAPGPNIAAPSRGMSVGVIVGSAVAGTLVLVLAVALAALACYRFRQRVRAAPAADPAAAAVGCAKGGDSPEAGSVMQGGAVACGNPLHGDNGGPGRGGDLVTRSRFETAAATVTEAAAAAAAAAGTSSECKAGELLVVMSNITPGSPPWPGCTVRADVSGPNFGPVSARGIHAPNEPGRSTDALPAMGNGDSAPSATTRGGSCGFSAIARDAGAVLGSRASGYGCMASPSPSPSASASGNGNGNGSGNLICVAGVWIDPRGLLGGGSYGKVFRGVWHGRPAAVKVLQYGAELCRAVHNEVLLSQTLRHPNVVSALHFVQIGPDGAVCQYGEESAMDPPPPDGSGGPGSPEGAPSPTRLALSGGFARHMALSRVHPVFHNDSSQSSGGRQPRRISIPSSPRPSIAAVNSNSPGAQDGGMPGGLAPPVLPPMLAHSVTAGGHAALMHIVAPLQLRSPGPGTDLARQLQGAACSKGYVSLIPLPVSRSTTEQPVLPPLQDLTADQEPEREYGSLLRSRDERLMATLGSLDRPGKDGFSCLARASMGSLPEGGGGGRAVADNARRDSAMMVYNTSFRSSAAGLHTTSAEPRSRSRSGSQQVEAPRSHRSGCAGLHGRTVAPNTLPPLQPQSLQPLQPQSLQPLQPQSLPQPATARRALLAHSHLPSLSPPQPQLVSPLGQQPQPHSREHAEAVIGSVDLMWLAAQTQPAEGSSHGFLVMELCEGGSLDGWRRSRWRDSGQLPDMVTLLHLAQDIARGMAFIHDHGICHGDLKLSNILLTDASPVTRGAHTAPAVGSRGPDALPASAAESGSCLRAASCCEEPLVGARPRHLLTAKVCDFGLARVLGSDATHVSTRPHGTTTHLAPEVWAEGHISQQSDCYAFGITMWELATGERPFRGLGAGRILHQVMLRAERPPVPSWLPASYSRIMQACWAQEPESRPAFADVVAQLEEALTHVDTTASDQRLLARAAAAALLLRAATIPMTSASIATAMPGAAAEGAGKEGDGGGSGGGGPQCGGN